MEQELNDLFANIANCRHVDVVEELKWLKGVDYEQTGQYEEQVKPLKHKYIKPIVKMLLRRYNIPKEHYKAEYDNLFSGIDQMLNGLFNEFVEIFVNSLV